MTTGLLAQVLVGAGVLVCVAACLGALVPRRPLDRIHFVTPLTSLGTPLIGLGLAVATGWHLAGATILLTAGVVALTGPALATATARLAANDQDGQES